MKEGTAYAKALKKAYAHLREQVPAPTVGELDEPLERLALGILAEQAPEPAARKALERIRSTTIDWNDVRVSQPRELAKLMTGLIPEPIQAARRLTQVLQALYDEENALSLDRLRDLPRREARQFLEGLPGVSPHAAAMVMLWSLGGHAIPVSAPLFAELQAAELVHPSATPPEVQAFLERHVAADDARAFCLIMQAGLSQLAGRGTKAKTAAAKKKAKTAKTAKRKTKAKTKKKAKTKSSKTSPRARGGKAS